MDVQLNSPMSYRLEPVVRIARRAMAAGAALVLLLCVIIAVRGLLGEFASPVSVTLLVLAAVTGELLASAFRILWLRFHPDAGRPSALFARLVLPSICVVCVALALSMAAASGWAVGAVWIVVAGGELTWWHPGIRALGIRALRRRCSEHNVMTTNFDLPSRSGESAGESAGEADEIGVNVLQQLTRSRNSEGVEIISGVLRAEFAPGERSHNLHVAFCPPLVYEPAVITHQLDGSPLAVKVAQTEIFGTRIELRLPVAARAADSATIFFEVHPPKRTEVG